MFKVNVIPKDLRLGPPKEKYKMPKMDRDVRGKWTTATAAPTAAPTVEEDPAEDS